MAPLSGHKGLIHIDIGQTTTFAEIVVVSSNSDTLMELITVSELGDDGEQRITGRTDFTLDVTINLDITLAQHRALITAIRDGTLIDVRVIPDRDNAGNYIGATTLAGNAGISLAGGAAGTLTVNFSNSDGAKWVLTTV